MTFKLDHIHLFTFEPETTAAWFAKHFGAEVVRSRQPDGGTRTDIKLGETFVFLSTPPGLNQRPADGWPWSGFDHLGIIADDVDGVIVRLESQGVEILQQPFTPRPGVRAAFVRGPDQIRVELLQRAP